MTQRNRKKLTVDEIRKLTDEELRAACLARAVHSHARRVRSAA
jgi:hypothetical protein